MIISNEHSTAEDGTVIHSTVKLRLDAIGISSRPFYVKVYVGSDLLFRALEATEADAKATREQMHAAYLDAHRQKEGANAELLRS